MSHRARQALAAVLCAGVLLAPALLLHARPAAAAPAPAPAAQQSAPLAASVEKLQIQAEIAANGATGLSASFLLLSGAEEVRDVRILAPDLVAADGRRIASSQYTVSPATIALIAPQSAELVNVTVSTAAPGAFLGALQVFYTSTTGAGRLSLPIEFTARALPELELAPGSAQLALAADVPAWGLGRAPEPVVFALKQKAQSEATLRPVVVLGPPATIADARPLPASAVTLSPSGPVAVQPGAWQTFTVAVDPARLPAGHYAATLVVSAEGADDLQVTLDVQLRDNWLLPLLVAAVGVALSWVIAYMAGTGTGRLDALRAVDALGRSLEDSGALSKDTLEEFARRRADLDRRARREPPEAIREAIQQSQEALDKNRAEGVKWHRQVRDWQASLATWQRDGDEHVQALMSSPWAAGLPARLEALEKQFAEGGYDRGAVAGDLKALGREFHWLSQLNRETFAAILRSEDENVQALAPSLKADLAAATGPDHPDMDRVLTALVSAQLISEPAATEVVLHHYAATPEDEGRAAGAGLLGRLGAWLANPRQYLTALKGVLGLLFLGLLLAAGMQTLYMNNATFGANPFGDYLGMLLWGIGADASRKQLKDLDSVGNFLGQRTGAAPPQG
jgi:hypothetical protein